MGVAVRMNLGCQAAARPVGKSEGQEMTPQMTRERNLARAAAAKDFQD